MVAVLSCQETFQICNPPKLSIAFKMEFARLCLCMYGRVSFCEGTKQVTVD